MRNETPSPHARTVFVQAVATLALTAAHHVYGGIIYQSHWRLHGAVLVVPIGAVLYALLRVYRKRPSARAGRIAALAFTAVAVVFPIVTTGLFEGFYNHVLKNLFFFGGASHDLLMRMFPPPTYEMPNDAIFEVSGIAQVVPAFFAAIAAVRFVGDLVRAGGPRTPGQLQPGDHFDRRHLVTVRGERIVVPDERRIVHLQFRRFAGCPVCNLHLRSIVRRHDEIVAAGIHEVVFFHSSADDLREHTSALPFHVVADPDKHLYDELGVESSPRAMLDPRAWIPIVRAVLVGAIAILRGRAKPPAANPHGGRYGLPADFLIDTDGRVLAAHYGEHVDDQWSVDEVLELAARPVMRRAETTLRPAEAP